MKILQDVLAAVSDWRQAGKKLHIKATTLSTYASAGATMSLIYVAGLVLIWFAPETRGRPLPE